MPDWNAPGAVKPATPLVLPPPSATPLSEEVRADSRKAVVARFKDQVQADLQYLYCHIIRYAPWT